jgi:hypothetical protein
MSAPGGGAAQVADDEVPPTGGGGGVAATPMMATRPRDISSPEKNPEKKIALQQGAEGGCDSGGGLAVLLGEDDEVDGGLGAPCVSPTSARNSVIRKSYALIAVGHLYADVLKIVGSSFLVVAMDKDLYKETVQTLSEGVAGSSYYF